ncbi:MAG: TonB-dependent receptor [Candidatus Brocadiaceae baterium WH-1]|nr:MAG: TonB-dependent receptor [Candidatus Jettenia sp. AMX2]
MKFFSIFLILTFLFVFFWKTVMAGEMQNQSTEQDVNGKQREVDSSVLDTANADTFPQSEKRVHMTGSSQDDLQPSTNSASPADEPILLPAVFIYGRADSLLGIADAASQGTVGRKELGWRALSRPGEVLETVPGLILTQHSGAGKANQFFLRGFNLDHGTDFATSIDGIPVNLPTHGHGQGYTDLNIIIPEMIDRVNFRKGVYYADLGDFSSAGAADIQYVRSLPQSIVRLEGGSFGYGRGLYASSQRIGSGDVLYAVEVFHEDGPWSIPNGYKKINSILRYSRGTAGSGYSVTAMAYAGEWTATDQIASRALRDIPGFGRFDSLDSSNGGNSQRYSLSTEWYRADAQSSTKILAYGFYYDLDLFGNFTYFLDSPQGDQILQQDKRGAGGIKASQTWYDDILNRDMENTVGLQIRSDWIQNGLFQTVKRRRTDKVDYDGETISATIRADNVWQTSISPYIENKVQWADAFRTVSGVRMDYYYFDVDSNISANSGTRDDVIVSPKGSLIFGPWAKTEYYLSGGLGFHSNDGRGVTLRIDPKTGEPAARSDPLVRTKGAEIGMRTNIVPGLHSTLALWWLEIDSELVFSGDAAITEESAASRRYGVEWTNYYTPTSWFSLNADFSFSHAEFRETVEGAGVRGRHIPGSVESVIATGITFHPPGEYGFFGELRLRFFGPRPLTEDNSVRSHSTSLLSAKVGYIFNKNWTLSVEGFNLLDRRDHDITYYYPSRLKNEATGPVDGGHNNIHFKTVEPIAVRAALTFKF